MKTFFTIRRFFILSVVILIVWSLIGPEILEARGGRGGFGGGRSFGGFRSSRPSGGRTFSSRQAPKSSFGGARSTPSTPAQQKVSSFGGSRLNTSRDYTAKYGAPRKTMTSSQMSGVPGNMVVNHYGGYGSGLMMGYMMGQTSWMWAMPFHPAFYYSRPYYSQNPDGTTSVYPPTFSWGKVFFTLIILFAVGYIIFAMIRNRKRQYGGSSGQSSFS